MEENIKRWKLFIYRENNNNTWVAEKAFNKPEEILDMLEKYKGFWCRIVDLSTLEILLEGTFDNTYLEENIIDETRVSLDKENES